MGILSVSAVVKCKIFSCTQTEMECLNCYQVVNKLLLHPKSLLLCKDSVLIIYVSVERHLCNCVYKIQTRYFILEGADLLDHTSIFLLRTINHRVIPIIRILS